ncbi:hypothetical protein TPHA_0G03270 [Tetrapisispora phaffii CBS 4417]|uniref:Ribosomal protein S2 n=1 Tax=Tetrapisispora phaffii (strain ATCC 24235 / CBS 4417 / NBRC 1672 / NRRL Y-8282 / UCD 70-5) TaxID=1071381 RepID=G8BW89_TETPH|nr:mitochondrial 37S ribosomal protein MRP4 TPHA_0G03270 [Tetrapisispora phaffii CBS 4417]CCE64167.1 hypothetical protein TPHA_0G03270 [Tetrapisispora phaffii CBS 4417]
MSVSLLFRNIPSSSAKRVLLLKSIRCYSTPVESSDISVSNLEHSTEEEDDVFLLRQKQYNDQLVESLKKLKATPVEEIEGLADTLETPLTEKEKQLDAELFDFLKKYSQSNKIIETDNLNMDNIDSSSSTLSSSINAFKGSNTINGKKFPYLIPSQRDKPYTTQELFLRQLKHASHTAKLGANIHDIYFPHKDISSPSLPEKMTMSKLLAAGVHLGQSTALWRASTQPFIYGEYKGIHIIDLNQTLHYLKRAAKVVEGITEQGGIVLFLGTREGQKKALYEAAKRTRGYYVSSRWIPGTLTNPTEISSSWERHEVDMLDRPTGRELSPEEQTGIVKPDLLVILNPTENRNALNEAMQARVPTIGIIDTDSEPSIVTYPIPGNDDSLRSVNLLLGVLAKAGERGLKNRLQKASN